MAKEKNAKNSKKKPWGSPISPKLANDFDNHIEERGYLKYKAIECALRVFMSLPADIQGSLMAEKSDDFLATLTRELHNRDRKAAYGGLSDSQRKKMLALAEQVAKIASRKD